MDFEVGNVLKRLRKKNNLTLKNMAEKTGLSAGYLSLLERGLSSPTLKNLNSICQAMNVTMADLILDISAEDNIVNKKGNRHELLNEKGYHYEVLTPHPDAMQTILMTVTDNKEHISFSHIADEIGYIISGTITMIVEGDSYELEPGDCIYIAANRHHGYQKTSEEDCVSIWFYNNTDSTIGVHDQV
ncbi:MAG TPA: hypothetical protein DF613_13435 [Lachnospiraceae bacterium]|nr:hypothetical protein [Lachnospiraceae bacterium]